VYVIALWKVVLIDQWSDVVGECWHAICVSF